MVSLPTRLSAKSLVVRVVHTRRATTVVMIGLCLLVFATYINGVHIKPVAEDFYDPRQFLEIGQGKQFRPVFATVMLTLELLAGPEIDSPGAYHLFSLVIHVVSVLSLFCLGLRLTSSTKVALAVALVFALYPRNHEIVYWPASSAHSIMVASLILSVLCYIKGRRDNSRFWLVPASVLFAVGVLDSEAGIAEIPLLLTYEVLWYGEGPGPGLGFRQRALRIVPWLLPLVIIGVVFGATLVLGSSNPPSLFSVSEDTKSYHLSLGPARLKDLGGYLSYTLFFFLPLRSLTLTIKLAMLTVTGAILGVCLLRGSKFVRFGVIWIFVTVLPYALFVPFGNADRYFYLPSVGLAIVLMGVFQMSGAFIAGQIGERGFRYAQIGRLMAIVIYLIVGFTMLRDRSVEWHEAGEMVDGMLAQILNEHPTINENATFYFVGLPHTYKQARFIGLGMRFALRDRYHQSNLSVYASDDAALLTAIEAAPTVSSSSTVSEEIYAYVYQNGRLIDRSSHVVDPTIRSLLQAQVKNMHW